MKSYWYLFWGYSAIWIGLLGYVFFLARSARTISRRLDGIETATRRQSSGDS